MEKISNLVDKTVRVIPNFPKEGINFRDITTLLNNSKAFEEVVSHLKDRYKDKNIDFIVGIESRGFIFGTALAYALGIGFVPIRKKGKLPFKTISEKYELEYGFDEIEMHIDAFQNVENPNVVLIDDLIATGGTAKASLNLIRKLNGNIVESCFIIELLGLNGSKCLDCDVYSILKD